MELSVILVGILILLVLLFASHTRRLKNFPPGPIGLPLIGNIHQIGLFGHKVARRLTKKYGDILGVRFGMQWIVILHDPEDIREAFSQAEFAGRTGFNATVDETVEDCNHGIVMSFGKAWTEQRRFGLRTLRDLGVGKRSIEGIIMEEVRELIIQLQKNHCDQPITTDHIFNMAVFNIIWSIVSGNRQEYGDPKLQQLIDVMSEFMQSVFTGPTILLFLFPVLVNLRKWKHRLFGRRQKRFHKEIYGFFRETIREHKRTMDEANPRDFIDAYLAEIKGTKDPESSFYRKNPDDDTNIIITLLDLFLAGSETTSTTLQWGFFILSQHQEIQEKLFHKIRSTVGHREVLLADRPNLPFVEATIMEVLRFSEIIPLGTPHATTKDVVFKGFFLPKNTFVLANIYAAHNAPIWEDPESFRPERFLSPDGRSIVRNKAWMPFSVGKRACMGEALARDELFLFFANLVQNMKILMPKDEPPHTYESRFRVAFVPEPHRILLQARN